MNIAIIGMGALGLLFGDMLQQDPSLSVGFIVDSERLERYRHEPIAVNGVPKRFAFLPAARCDTPADVVIFAVKATALDRAMADAAAYVGSATVLLSLLNGISSEQALETRFGRDRVVYCTAQGMDAVREGRTLRYS